MSNKNNRQMVINYVPGEECRVAVTDDGRLEELHAERMDNASHVGNIYVGRVVNVEPGIQAAFVDFGLEANGFLHVTDLHPRYFPGEDQETTERVGKKTPRRERPPIQACLRRGQEIAVQVLKEGVGTKGPTVTSYLSIPGRFLVMMPLMDKVGVSRKVEDEETRRKMREILDQLDLPDGFGFILRTAGMDRGKMELKRDLAYLQRLWKDMEKRWKTGNKPRLLYSESDLLVRALRDILTTEIDRVVIDNESALNRAARFLKIVAPRSSTKLVRYTGTAPLFHAMGIEQQIQMIHAREVPLPGGGRLVIDETEALVAIDVNSGKMRDARDAETTAYRTNMEAADEIARQLRLRDVGGVIINDFIDMRSLKHRRELEARFKENLKNDRARTTTAPVSPFGVIEMTRQRMRGSHESVHFAGCPTCRGRGLLQRPESVAADGLRELQAILSGEHVARVELVVSPRIAGELLSTKRKALSRVERTMGKRVDVRVSEAIPLDRVSFYAYDERGADIDVTKVHTRPASPNELVPFDAPDLENWTEEPEPPAEPDETPVEDAIEPLHPIELDMPDDQPGAIDEPRAGDGDARGDQGERKRRRRRGGRGRNRGDRDQGNTRPGDDRGPGTAPPHAQQDHHHGLSNDAIGANGSLRLVDSPADQPHPPSQGAEPGERTGRRRRRRGGRGRGKGGAGRDGAHPRPHAEHPAQQPEQHARRDDSRESDGDSAEFPSEPATDHNHVEQTGEFGGSVGAFLDRGNEPNGHPQGDGHGGANEGAGEGGRRRRRRRRRGGRGRGQDGPMPGGPGEANPQESRANYRRLDQPDAPEHRGEHAPDDTGEHERGSSTPTRDNRHADGADSSEEGGGGGGKRRRRRRGGRGRGRGGDRDANAPGSPDSGQSSSGRPEDRRSGGGHSGQGNSAPQRNQQQPPGGRSGSQGSPAQPPAPQHGPRTLYGGARRKLGPGELRSRPKGDE